jgi:hypothetical protein
MFRASSTDGAKAIALASPVICIERSTARWVATTTRRLPSSVHRSECLIGSAQVLAQQWGGGEIDIADGTHDRDTRMDLVKDLEQRVVR